MASYHVQNLLKLPWNKHLEYLECVPPGMQQMVILKFLENKFDYFMAARVEDWPKDLVMRYFNEISGKRTDAIHYRMVQSQPDLVRELLLAEKFPWELDVMDTHYPNLERVYKYTKLIGIDTTKYENIKDICKEFCRSCKERDYESLKKCVDDLSEIAGDGDPEKRLMIRGSPYRYNNKQNLSLDMLKIMHAAMEPPTSEYNLPNLAK